MMPSDNGRYFASGDRCPIDGCNGHMTVYSSDIITVGIEDYRRQYLWCAVCRHKPQNNKIFCPMRFASRKPGMVGNRNSRKE